PISTALCLARWCLLCLVDSIFGGRNLRARCSTKAGARFSFGCYFLGFMEPSSYSTGWVSWVCQGGMPTTWLKVDSLPGTGFLRFQPCCQGRPRLLSSLTCTTQPDNA